VCRYGTTSPVNITIPGEVWSQKTFDFSSQSPLPKAEECVLTVSPYPTNSYVVYGASMELSNGSIIRDSNIRHGANFSNTVKEAYNYIFPIYRRGSVFEKFSVLVVADEDYPDENEYIDDVGTYLFKDTGSSNGFFADIHLKGFRRFFNIYINDFSKQVEVENIGNCGSGSTVHSEYPPNWWGVFQFFWSPIDVLVYLAHEDFGCAEIGLGGGRRANVNNIGNMTHEILHALAGREDEYSRQEVTDSQNDAVGPHKNVFNSESECIDHATTFHSSEYPTSAGCRRLGTGTYPYWHWDDEDDVMTSGPKPLGQEERYQILDMIGDQGLSAFSLISSDLEDSTGVLERANRVVSDDLSEGSESRKKRTLSMELVFDDTSIVLSKTRILNGPAPHLFFEDLVADYQISVLDKNGRSLVSFWTGDPLSIPEDGGVGKGRLGRIQADFRVEWQETMSRVKIQNREGKTVLNAGIMPQD
jgi:hypothetical protein